MYDTRTHIIVAIITVFYSATIFDVTIRVCVRSLYVSSYLSNAYVFPS